MDIFPYDGRIRHLRRTQKYFMFLGLVNLLRLYCASQLSKSARSGGYGWRLMFERSWVPIPAPYTGWTFFTLIRCKNCIICLNRLKINEKEAGVGPFKKSAIVSDELRTAKSVKLQRQVQIMQKGQFALTPFRVRSKSHRCVCTSFFASFLPSRFLPFPVL